MNNYSNKHLLEVACTFNFKKSQSNKQWDSSYFGLYFEKISSLGFTLKEERKGLQIQFSASSEDIKNNTFSKFSEVESKMIFRNPTEKYAIVLGENSVSFNKIGSYTNWNDFLNTFINKYYNLYLELGLDYEISNCQVVYLNNFNFKQDDELSRYFNLVTKLDNIGIENSCQIQRSFIINDEVSLLGKLFYNSINNTKQVYLECGAFSLPKLNESTLNFTELANKTKEPIRDFFEQIITTELKNIL